MTFPARFPAWLRGWSGAFALTALAALAAAPAAAVDPGAAAPAFALPDGRGEVITLEKLRGRVVYVDFWASWCGPCRQSFPWMNEMQRKYGAQGFTIVGINVDKRDADAQRFLQQVPATFTVVYDPKGQAPAAYGVKAMPNSYLIDAQGRVAGVEYGFKDDRKADLERQIAALLATR
jgi:cytochrome c biogenesis protein CcmG, thiol:disulfide interchange protein DsbE